jgi:hypothetical protein
MAPKHSKKDESPFTSSGDLVDESNLDEVLIEEMDERDGEDEPVEDGLEEAPPDDDDEDEDDVALEGDPEKLDDEEKVEDEEPDHEEEEFN